MSEIKNVGLTWMALNTLKCCHRNGLFSCAIVLIDVVYLDKYSKTNIYTLCILFAWLLCIVTLILRYLCDCVFVARIFNSVINNYIRMDYQS